MGSIITSGTKSRSGYSKTKSRQTPTYNPKSFKYHYVDKYNEPTNEYWHREQSRRESRRIHELDDSTLSQNMPSISIKRQNELGRNWNTGDSMDQVEARIKRKKENN
jgi:hypothetical protein